MSDQPRRFAERLLHQLRRAPAGRIAALAHREFRDTLTSRQRSALVAYLTYAITVAAVRGVTVSVRKKQLGLRDVVVGPVHIHHYLPGIALLATAGALGVRGSDKLVVHCLAGATYGAGCGLVTDELPLLLALRDVYWTEEGRWATELILSIVGLVGAYFTAVPFWRALRVDLAAVRWRAPVKRSEEDA
ncbi:hypothetical protein [Micromonospora sp. WMMD812]|uniref:hypothetical protein n=1 Tax=Micromonospora sp. WMMD812 TaxID=3015152 RepID=UPI00248C683C|nr:hypothetical protein [Micromonospora sp. WMMD812]WBB70064.1 hypothetical protein O7603_12160 [Micromonospora sp. WMMD812]